MGIIRNIKASIDDKSSMSVNSVTVLASAVMGVVVGLVMCFVLVYDVTFDGKVDTDMGDMAMLLMSSGIYILGSGAPKAYVDSRLKTRAWVENEKIQINADEDLKDCRAERRKKRKDKGLKEDEPIDTSFEENELS